MGNYLISPVKCLGFCIPEQEMSVGVTLFYKVNLDLILSYSYGGIPLYFN